MHKYLYPIYKLSYPFNTIKIADIASLPHVDIPQFFASSLSLSHNHPSPETEAAATQTDNIFPVWLVGPIPMRYCPYVVHLYLDQWQYKGCKLILLQYESSLLQFWVDIPLCVYIFKHKFCEFFAWVIIRWEYLHDCINRLDSAEISSRSQACSKSILGDKYRLNLNVFILIKEIQHFFSRLSWGAVFIFTSWKCSDSCFTALLVKPLL